MVPTITLRIEICVWRRGGKTITHVRESEGIEEGMSLGTEDGY
jgi:hypothetical protein